MNRRERIEAALRGEPVDRVPVSLWRHFHRTDRTPQGLAQATVGFAREFDVDLVKVTPCGLYAVENWGAPIAYPKSEHEAPYLKRPTFPTAEGWRHLAGLDPRIGALGRELEALRLIAAELAGQVPFLMTLFSPLTLAFKLVGERVVEDLRQHPLELHIGLAVIAETTARFAEAVLNEGTDGFFFATQLATAQRLSRQEYEEFGTRYDLVVLDRVAQAPIRVLHLHGVEVFFDLANAYPVNAVSWHDRETSPSLAEARSLTDRALLTGLDRTLLENGPEEAIAAQARDALAQTRGRGLILAPSCVIPTRTLAAYLRAVRVAVQG